MQLVEDYDAMELLLGGVHENLLTIPYTDACMTKSEAALDWLSYTDIMSAHAMKGGGMGGLYAGYLSPACMAIHMLCSVDYRSKILWPKKASLFLCGAPICVI